MNLQLLWKGKILYSITNRLRTNFGISNTFADRISLELRKNSNNTLIRREEFWDTQYKSLEFILGVRVF